MLRSDCSHLLGSCLAVCLISTGEAGLALSGDLCKLRRQRLLPENDLQLSPQSCFLMGTEKEEWEQKGFLLFGFYSLEMVLQDDIKCRYCNHLLHLNAPSLSPAEKSSTVYTVQKNQSSFLNFVFEPRYQNRYTDGAVAWLIIFCLFVYFLYWAG